MGIYLLRDRLGQLKNLFRANPIFQKSGGLSKANPEIVKVSRGVALLLLAALLAWISKTETENSTRESILNSEWPPVQVRNDILKAGGWTRDHSDLSTLLKNHPDPFSTQAIIWESEDHCLIYLTSAEPELWACATGHTLASSKIKWHKIGSGYAGLNRLSQIVVPSAKKVASYIDPKEIRY
jgi:hypothetical protein